jgi:methylenetetrahydrofolate dehydrogenase (NADP+)/methenyltetrahydrofolate cyclohydrolase
MAMRRPNCNAAVTVVHTGVEDMAALTRTADVIVSAAGVPGIVTADMVKSGCAVVGAGTSFAGKKLLSDIADDVAEKVAWITPRLGGVGPMTRAMLLRNAVLAAEKVR